MKRKTVGIIICMLLITTTIPAVADILNDNKILDVSENFNNLIKQKPSGCSKSGDWLEQDKLLSTDGETQDDFGYSVSIDGNYAVIGASDDDDNGLDSGSAYIFKCEGTTWSQQAKLLPSDGATDDDFGYSVSISGDYAIIGARFDDDNGENSGSAYIFKRTGENWLQQAKLTASEPDANFRFGESVSICGEYAIVGEFWRDTLKGAAYIFKRTDENWPQQAKLTHPNPNVYGGFGCSVSISGDYALIGARYDDNATGTAFVFERSGTTWSFQAKLMASDPYGKEFGNSVSIDEDYAIIGAYADNYLGIWTGSAYIFKRTGTTWSQQAKLTASDDESGKYFGISVSISGDYTIVGAMGDDDNGYDAGAAYIFKRTDSTWSEQKKLIPTDNEAGDQFGFSVCIDGNYAIIGSPGDDDNAYDAGAAYIFNRGEPIPDIPILQLVNIRGGVLGFSVGLKNFGEKTAYDITWEMVVLDGLLFPDRDGGEIPYLEPDEEIRIPLKWKFGLGKSTIEFRCHYTISFNGTRAGFDVSAKQEWNDLGFLIGHSFPEFMQPVKEWKEIESYDYQEDIKAKGVILNYDFIQGNYNVRVVRGLDSGNSEVEFFGLCEFTDGEAFIEEGWITRSDIENNYAYWEVELVDVE